MAASKGKIYIGTSGWMYKDWHDSFYPEDLPKTDLLKFYASQFSSVEVNVTFYRLVTANTIAGWIEKAPRHFVYAIKGSRLITHNKRLMDIDQPLSTFLERIAPLHLHLAPILWQLPPSFQKNLQVLESFLSKLPRQMKHAMEFRHVSWFDDEVTEILRTHGVAQVWVSSLSMPQTFEGTSDFIYLRFHGLQQGYRHNYTAKDLEAWAEQLLKQAQLKKSAYVYFNNDGYAHAPQNAKLLREMVKPFAVLP